MQTMTAKKTTKPGKAKRADQTVIYMRLPIVVLDRVRKIADKRGWPHTIASVGAEALERGLDVETTKTDEKKPDGRAKKTKSE